MQRETIYNLYIGIFTLYVITLLFKTNFRGHGLFPSESIPLATCTAMYLRINNVSRIVINTK